MKTHYYDLFTRVLIYKEGSRFVAHALDYDLLGYGRTEEEARRELDALVENQLSFAAATKEKPEMINFPAPKEFFKRWEKVAEAQRSGKKTRNRPWGLSTKAAVIGFTISELRKLRNRNKGAFSKTEKLAFA
jgi:hypothetical protein